MRPPAFGTTVPEMLRLMTSAATAFLFIGLSACAPPSTTEEANPAPEQVQEAPSPPDTLTLSWSIDTNEGTYGMPESIIYLNAGGLRFPIASGPGMREMSADQRERFKAPEGALAAAGYWAGFGVNLLVTQNEGTIRIQEAIWDEGGGAEAAHDYEDQAVITTTDILAAKDNPFSGPTWSGCFEGQHEVTTSTYGIIVENGQLTADVQLVIEDDRNAYYTSARIAGGGQQIGSHLFVEQYITIEDDNQNNVAIWHLDDPSDPQMLTVDERDFERCSPE